MCIRDSPFSVRGESFQCRDGYTLVVPPGREVKMVANTDKEDWPAYDFELVPTPEEEAAARAPSRRRGATNMQRRPGFRDIMDQLAWEAHNDALVDATATVIPDATTCTKALRDAEERWKKKRRKEEAEKRREWACLLYTSPSPRDLSTSRMPSSA